MPRLRAIAAAAVCPGAFNSMRPPYRMSRQNEPMTALLAGPDLQARPEPRLSHTTVRLGKVLQAAVLRAARGGASGLRWSRRRVLDFLVRGRGALEVAARGGAESAPEGEDEGAGALVADRVRGAGDGAALGEQLQRPEEPGPLPPEAERQAGLGAEQPFERPRAGGRGAGDLGQGVAR